MISYEKLSVWKLIIWAVYFIRTKLDFQNKKINFYNDPKILLWNVSKKKVHLSIPFQKKLWKISKKNQRTKEINSTSKINYFLYCNVNWILYLFTRGELIKFNLLWTFTVIIGQVWERFLGDMMKAKS